MLTTVVHDPLPLPLHMFLFASDWSHVAGVLYEARVEMTAASNPSDVQVGVHECACSDSG
jgi:hypothetical protein